MNSTIGKSQIEEVLEKVSRNELTVAQAMIDINGQRADLLSCAHLDRDRRRRTEIPEVIFGEGKEAWQIIEIARQMLNHSHVVVVTRVSVEKAGVVMQAVPELTYYKHARMLIGNRKHITKNGGRGTVVVVSAGTSDMPVAEEACLTVECLGHKVERAYDVGVAGIHRLFAHHEMLNSASVVVAVAGMEGALPSVVAGLICAPVIAVPTSVGYGTGLGGIAALLAMLNSCAPGVAVVNIDNGFGAGCMAVSINRVTGKE